MGQKGRKAKIDPAKQIGNEVAEGEDGKYAQPDDSHDAGKNGRLDRPDSIGYGGLLSQREFFHAIVSRI
jgi:hypothetical protein